MSILAASDIVTTNLLTELNLNPVWEKWRSYFFAGSVVCSLFPFYMTSNGVDLHCVQLRDSTISEYISLNCTEISNRILSTSHTVYVNSQCGTDGKLLVQRYAGSLMLAIAILILFVSSAWLHFQDVKDGIKTFIEAGEKFVQPVMSNAEMVALCSKSLTGEEPKIEVFEYTLQEDGYEIKTHKAVRQFMRFCAFCAPKSIIFSCYLVRNIILILVMTAATGFCLWAATVSDLRSEEFVCRIRDGSEIIFKEFVCTNNSVSTIKLFLELYCGTLFTQIILIVYAIYRIVLLRKPSRNISLRMLAEFWESANSVQSGLLRNMVNYVHSKRFNRAICDRMKSICKDKDYELIRMKVKLLGSAPEVIDVVCNRFLELSRLGNVKMAKEECVEPLKEYMDAMREYKCPDVDIIKRMYDRCLVTNEFICYLLQSHKDMILLQDRIKLDRVEDQSSRNGHLHSILYYAFMYRILPSSVARTLCQMKHESILKVFEKTPHTDDSSTPLRQFLASKRGMNDNSVNDIMNKCEIIQGR